MTFNACDEINNDIGMYDKYVHDANCFASLEPKYRSVGNKRHRICGISLTNRYHTWIHVHCVSHSAVKVGILFYVDEYRLPRRRKGMRL